jgi:hypothetical protein
VYPADVHADLISPALTGLQAIVRSERMQAALASPPGPEAISYKVKNVRKSAADLRRG